MIRLGNAILSEDAIECIQPGRNAVEVWLRSGRVAVIPYATMDEAHDALAEAGFIEPLPAEPEPVLFTEHELEHLRFAFRSGMRYAAKDADGRAYVFQEAPRKGEHSWINDDSRSRVGRLKGDFPALSFEDDVPLDLAAVLGEEDAVC